MVSANAAKSFCRYSSRILLQSGGAEMALQHFAGRRRHRHRHVHFAGEFEAEIEVLAQQLRRERRRPVEIDQRRRFIAREHRAHHAIVEKGEKGVARHAHLVGQQRDLDQVLDDDAEHDIVRDLADAREFAVADIGHAARREDLDQRHGDLAGGFRARHDGGQLAGLDHLGIAAHRRGDEIGVELLELVADLGGFLDRDGRAIDDDRRHLAALAADAVLAVEHLLHVLAGGDDREQHIDVLEIGQMIDHLAADLFKRLGLGARAVPDRNVMAGLDEPLGHRKTHPAHADPADLLRVLRGHARTPLSKCAVGVVLAQGAAAATPAPKRGLSSGAAAALS